jgi:hypothetical protein
MLQNKTNGNWQYGRYYEGDKNSGNILVDWAGRKLGDVTSADRITSGDNYVYSLSFDSNLLGLGAG